MIPDMISSSVSFLAIIPEELLDPENTFCQAAQDAQPARGTVSSTNQGQGTGSLDLTDEDEVAMQ